MAHLDNTNHRLADLRAKSEQLPTVSKLAIMFAHKVLTWNHTYRSRCKLRNLTNSELQDIGISRAEAKREADKAFWRQ
jgi:uncharacterized protein YjiS (DUF1127 family)